VTDAVIALGETSIVSCAKEPIATRLINVTATQHLVETLVDIGVNVTVLSSGAVFSGHAQYPTEESACDPATEYGRQKVELEDATLALEGTRILRLTKVLSPSTGRWRQWIQGIQKGENVQAFGNVKLSPLRMSIAVGAILKQIDLSFGRIVHVSPPDEVTYADAVSLMALELDLPVNLEALRVHSDVNRGILPDRCTALGTLYRNPALQIESCESAIRIFTRQVVG
jgi:dTDP-4-dehydrorhamnose reductase